MEFATYSILKLPNAGLDPADKIISWDDFAASPGLCVPPGVQRLPEVQKMMEGRRRSSEATALHISLNSHKGLTEFIPKEGLNKKPASE